MLKSGGVRVCMHMFVCAKGRGGGGRRAVMQILWLSSRGWPNKTTGTLWKSKWSLAKPTYQFFEGGNHPSCPVLLVMCICRMEMFHSGVESFDPVTCGGQPYQRKRDFTICSGVFPACWSAIISCTCCTRVSAAFMFFLSSVCNHSLTEPRSFQQYATECCRTPKNDHCVSGHSLVQTLPH